MRIVVVLVVAACAAPPPARQEPTDLRVLAVPEGSLHHDLFEGAGHRNECRADADCAPSGCAGEVCAAEPVATPCIVQADQPRDAACGCVRGTCAWYR